MIIKKLAVPLINEKILQQAEQCYIATSCVSDAAFEFIKSRMPLKSKIHIVTGVDEPTNPQVFRKILKHYQDRIILNLYTKNTFHANVYIFYLPFRKVVAFVGSGSMTLGGLKDHEELFYKITDPKEVEALMSWYTSYFEFGEELTENFINEYELLYPALKERAIQSKIEKREVSELTSRAFNWEGIKFKSQYFKKEDYLIFSNQKASTNNPLVVEERESLKKKLEQLASALKGHASSLGLTINVQDNLNPLQQRQGKLKSLNIYFASGGNEDFLKIKLAVQSKEVTVGISAGVQEGISIRNSIPSKLKTDTFQAKLFELASKLDKKYFLEVNGERKPIEQFQNAGVLSEFLKDDEYMSAPLFLGRSFSPGDPDLSEQNIAATLMAALSVLGPIYQHLISENQQ